MAAVRRLFTLFSICLFAGTSLVSGAELFVTHSPKYLSFRQDGGEIPTSQIPKIISTVFGHSLKYDLKWNGLEQGSLFQRPKANVLVTLEGVSTLDVNHIAKYPVTPDEPIIDTSYIANHLEGRSSGEKSLIIDFTNDNALDVRSKYPEIMGHLPGTLDEVREHLGGVRSAFRGLQLGSLNVTQQEDALFFGEIQVIAEVIEAMKSSGMDLVKDSSPDIFHFRFGSLNRLIERYGVDSQTVSDAMALINMFMRKLTLEFKSLYDGHVVIEMVTLPTVDSSKHVRKARSLLQAKPTPAPGSKKPAGLIGEIDENYAIIFNIILWTMIFLALTVAAVSYSLWTMDPGRDSIIYRMTSQRIKKD